MKQYQYNYSFLGKWMEANPQITNREILQAFGSVNNNNSLARYERCTTPLPIIGLLRFCNTFDVPISAFIVDGEEDMTQRVKPSIDDQLEPDGGYISAGEKRPHGSRTLRDPLEVNYHKSVIPGLTTIKTSHQEIQTGGIRQSATATHASIHQEASVGMDKSAQEISSPTPSASLTPSVPPTPSLSSVKPEPNAVSFSTLNKMLDIIAEQQKQIGEQQKLIAELTRRLEMQQGGYSMVAEDIHRDK